MDKTVYYLPEAALSICDDMTVTMMQVTSSSSSRLITMTSPMPFTGYEPLYNTVMELVASGVKIYEPEKN